MCNPRPRTILLPISPTAHTPWNEDIAPAGRVDPDRIAVLDQPYGNAEQYIQNDSWRAHHKHAFGVSHEGGPEEPRDGCEIEKIPPQRDDQILEAGKLTKGEIAH